MKILMKNRMKNVVNLLLLTSLFLIVSASELFATHAAGSDIKYRCLGGLQYEVEVTFYRDCGGVAEPSNITVSVKSSSGSQNLILTANKILGSGDEITVPCASSNSTCNGGSTTGIRKFVYVGSITLPSAQTDWTFSYNVCCRNCAITTINNPCASNSVLYVEAKLNNVLAPCNNAPNFTNIPIALVCLGQNFNYNHGVIDPDGDSLAYQLITPKTSATATVSFISPASATTPIASSTPFTLSPTTGTLNFTPSQVQIGVLAILVKEYRNGQLIGSVIRDMQVYITACTNNLPTASGINETNNFSTSVCLGQQVCFTVNSADIDTSQNVTITTNSGITGATYSISGGSRPKLTFCWTPSINDVSLNPKSFTLTVRDNSCPSNGIQNYSYLIYVQGPQFTIASSNISCNGSANGTATVTPVIPNSYSYSWNTTPPQTTSTINNLLAGTYAVVVTDNNGCSATKSITINQPLDSLSTKPTITNIDCNGNSSSVKLNTSGGTLPYSFLWSNGSTTENLNGIAAGTYQYTVTDSLQCKSTGSIEITQITNDLLLANQVTNVNCNGQNTGAINLTVTGGTLPYTYTWSNGSTSEDITNLSAGSYSATVTDANGCSQQFATTITEPSNPISASAVTKDADCLTGIQGSISVDVEGGTTPYNFVWAHGGTTQNVSGLLPGNYTVQLIDVMGCELTKAFTIVDRAQAQLTIRSLGDVTVCMGTSVTLTTDTLPGVSFQWNFNGTPLLGATSNTFITPAGGIFSLTATSSCGVFNSNPIEVTFRALNSVTINNNVIICPGETVQLMAGGGVEYTWTPSTGLNLDNVSNPIASPTKTTEYTVSVKDEYGCKATGSVTVAVVCDTVDIPNAYSPNGDGINDTFEIDGLSNYSGSILYIYNRWGNLIFKQKDYQNDWNGRSNVSGAMFGSELANGTYFYILDLNIGEKPLNGFVVIRR